MHVSLAKKKKMKYLSILLLIVVFSSCSNPSSKVLGKWKVEEIDYSSYFAEVPEEVRTFLEEQMKEEFLRLKDKTYFNFKDDNKLLLNAPNYNGDQTNTDGLWTMNSAGDSLFLELAERENYKIEKVDEKQMILSTNETPKRTLRLSKVTD